MQLNDFIKQSTEVKKTGYKEPIHSIDQVVELLKQFSKKDTDWESLKFDLKKLITDTGSPAFLKHVTQSRIKIKRMYQPELENHPHFQLYHGTTSVQVSYKGVRLPLWIGDGSQGRLTTEHEDAWLQAFNLNLSEENIAPLVNNDVSWVKAIIKSIQTLNSFLGTQTGKYKAYEVGWYKKEIVLPLVKHLDIGDKADTLDPSDVLLIRKDVATSPEELFKDVYQLIQQKEYGNAHQAFLELSHKKEDYYGISLKKMSHKPTLQIINDIDKTKEDTIHILSPIQTKLKANSLYMIADRVKFGTTMTTHKITFCFRSFGNAGISFEMYMDKGAAIGKTPKKASARIYDPELLNCTGKKDLQKAIDILKNGGHLEDEDKFESMIRATLKSGNVYPTYILLK